VPIQWTPRRAAAQEFIPCLTGEAPIDRVRHASAARICSGLQVLQHDGGLAAQCLHDLQPISIKFARSVISHYHDAEGLLTNRQRQGDERLRTEALLKARRGSRGRVVGI
jgi:hypothetical protein